MRFYLLAQKLIPILVHMYPEEGYEFTGMEDVCKLIRSLKLLYLWVGLTKPVFANEPSTDSLHLCRFVQSIQDNSAFAAAFEDCI